ncbi:hypothetical protein [Metallosphaera hakonensis]|uniref:Uncharacterized protein n=1 Tax=Metallosphaera hakonensis JCM 8857 = DSM 7519 TaxID=1293036 RepID=A0A2U9ITF4_9CREN|nr:hypothetical protein [Metallosphaera hakonensis]AWR99340.1 hypothetical protein DFR87_06030 [Metallosphaera hakonensis JCM 8857 = DSM 7519]
MDREDKLLILRGIMGGIAGLISNFLPSFLISIIVMIIFYVASLPIAIYGLKINNKKTTYTKGAITLIVAWFLILIIAYNILA